MRLTFIGADHEVTGSCHYLEACGKHILVDYGMEQGSNKFENVELPIAFSDVDYVLLTHAHIDHAGLLPLIYAKGFKGVVFATEATCDLCNIMLKDSAHIQEMEAEWKNRKARRAGKPEVEPLYTVADAEGVLTHFVPCRYGEEIELSDGIRLRFTDAGHLLGSASIEVWLSEDGTEKKIVFSGDIGNKNKPLIKNPSYIDEADYVVMECTYGDRYHERTHEHIEELADILQKTLDRGGNLVIPAFAVGRTQEILYFMRKIKEEHMISGHDGFEVYVDSPLAVEATHVFNENISECFDDEAMELVMRGINPIAFPGLKLSITSEESKAINFDMTPKVIISAAGMCDAGRIRHHLKYNLWRSDSTIVFVGFQSPGTLGRTLLDGAKSVKLFGEEIAVRAEIENFKGLSSHADRDHLLEWAKSFENPVHFFVVHGDREVAPYFADSLERLGLSAHAPQYTEVYDLAENRILDRGYLPERKTTTPVGKVSAAYQRLVAMGQLLQEVILRSKGRANRDLGNFADQIKQLIDRWEA